MHNAPFLHLRAVQEGIKTPLRFLIDLRELKAMPPVHQFLRQKLRTAFAHRLLRSHAQRGIRPGQQQRPFFPLDPLKPLELETPHPILSLPLERLRDALILRPLPRLQSGFLPFAPLLKLIGGAVEIMPQQFPLHTPMDAPPYAAGSRNSAQHAGVLNDMERERRHFVARDIDKLREQLDRIRDDKTRQAAARRMSERLDEHYLHLEELAYLCDKDELIIESHRAHKDTVRDLEAIMRRGLARRQEKKDLDRER